MKYKLPDSCRIENRNCYKMTQYIYIHIDEDCATQYLNDHPIIMIYLKFQFRFLLGGRIGLQELNLSFKALRSLHYKLKYAFFSNMVMYIRYPNDGSVIIL